MQPSIATAKGHLNQQWQRRHRPSNEEPAPTPITTRTNTIYAAIVDPKQPTSNSFSDLTDRFPIQSNHGANYIFVLYDYDSNAIIIRPLRNRSAQEILRVFTAVHAYLVTRGLRPHIHTLDNKASTNLKDFLTDEKVEYQLMPPHIHRRNSAKRAIQSFENHFMAGLASTDPNFPLSNWCRLLPQAELTLNLLRPSRLNPKLSAYALLEGAFVFTRTPLAPPGTCVIVHENPLNVALGPNTASMDGTLVPPWTTTNATEYGFHLPMPNALRTQSNFFLPSFAPRTYPTVMPLSKLHANSPTLSKI